MSNDRLSSVCDSGKGFYPVVKRRGDLEDFELPIWQHLGERWFAKVNRLARAYSITRADLLTEALTLFEKHRKTVAFKKAGGNPATEEDLRKTFGGFAKGWWDSLSPQQRAVEAKKRSKAAKIRWAADKEAKMREAQADKRKH